MNEIKEDFDVSKCRPETYITILENLSYYESHGDTEAINVFRSLKTQMESKCSMNPIIRSLNGAYNKPEKKEKLRTMIGYEQFEINENGSLSVIPEPQHKKSKVPDLEPECMIALRLNDKRLMESLTKKEE